MMELESFRNGKIDGFWKIDNEESIKLNFFGQPRFSQNEITQIASISENNTDILGAVIKSPLFPNGTFLT